MRERKDLWVVSNDLWWCTGRRGGGVTGLRGVGASGMAVGDGKTLGRGRKLMVQHVSSVDGADSKWVVLVVYIH